MIWDILKTVWKMYTYPLPLTNNLQKLKIIISGRICLAAILKGPTVISTTFQTYYNRKYILFEIIYLAVGIVEKLLSLS